MGVWRRVIGVEFGPRSREIRIIGECSARVSRHGEEGGRSEW